MGHLASGGLWDTAFQWCEAAGFEELIEHLGAEVRQPLGPTSLELRGDKAVHRGRAKCRREARERQEGGKGLGSLMESGECCHTWAMGSVRLAPAAELSRKEPVSDLD